MFRVSPILYHRNPPINAYLSSLSVFVTFSNKPSTPTQLTVLIKPGQIGKEEQHEDGSMALLLQTGRGETEQGIMIKKSRKEKNDGRQKDNRVGRW